MSFQHNLQAFISAQEHLVTWVEGSVLTTLAVYRTTSFLERTPSNESFLSYLCSSPHLFLEFCACYKTELIKSCAPHFKKCLSVTAKLAADRT